ncbi:MAG TPA: hypothetical protein PKC58_03670 [Ignavibacteria bacterium]|nr:hypothetical protein [Ignavibacteria bacterium]
MKSAIFLKKFSAAAFIILIPKNLYSFLKQFHIISVKIAKLIFKKSTGKLIFKNVFKNQKEKK